MKYCPYCGAEMINGTVSFCTECGERLNDIAVSPTKRKKEKSKKEKKTKKPSKPKKLPHEDTIREIIDEIEEIPQDDYDGYYDDIEPCDSAVIRQTIDKELIKKIILLIYGVLAVICACVVLMNVL